MLTDREMQAWRDATAAQRDLTAAVIAEALAERAAARSKEEHGTVESN